MTAFVALSEADFCYFLFVVLERLTIQTIWEEKWKRKMEKSANILEGQIKGQSDEGLNGLNHETAEK